MEGDRLALAYSDPNLEINSGIRFIRLDDSSWILADDWRPRGAIGANRVDISDRAGLWLSGWESGHVGLCSIRVIAEGG
jgi:hypothetical protein